LGQQTCTLASTAIDHSLTPVTDLEATVENSDVLNYLPLEKLNGLAQDNQSSYSSASPFAHAVFDGVFNPELLDKVIEEFHQVDGGWREFETKYEKKLQMNKYLHLRPTTRAFLDTLNSEPFLRFLETLTGIEGLIPDPYLEGAGIHKIVPGGKLGVHVDFNLHSIMNVYRRINVILYLNKDWQEEYGGHFELWDEHKNGCVKKVLPVYNRMAIFSTTSTSFHGHPNPLTCPEDRCRLSLALYYYTAEDNGAQARNPHSTVFLTEEGRREELTHKRTLLQRIKNKLFS
jgi:Rps23 Pro-64 3,4-dihydroxylase Tpa1-like proline 4-hydroxylase